MIHNIFFLFAALIVIIATISNIRNKHLPVVATKARLIMKKSDVQTHVHVNGAITNYETLILIFELESGSQVEFSVGDKNFKGVNLYERGDLTYKGKNFIRFESDCN